MAARCGRTKTVYRVTVRSAHGNAKRLVGSRIRTHLIGSASEAGPTDGGEPAPSEQPPNPAVLQAHAQAQSEWDTTDGTRVLSSFRTGQCTDWTAQKRSDIVERVWVEHEARALLGLEPEHSAYAVNWTAKYWDDNARAAGLRVGARPRRGAIAVFEPGAANASRRTGHVAYVEKVSRDGIVTISEMNAAAGPGRVNLRTVKPQPGVSFIY
jgi:surface antigen